MSAQLPGPIIAFGDSAVLDVTIDPTLPTIQTIVFHRRVAYRAFFSRPGVSLAMRAADRRKLPFVVSSDNPAIPGAGTSYEIYPQGDGPIDFEAHFISGSGPVRLQVWSDAHLTGLGSHAGEGGFLEFGMEFQVLPHPEYTRLGSVTAHPGITYGLCFSARNGPSPEGLVNGCLIGVEHITGGIQNQFWGIFAEPRLRLTGRNRPRTGWATDAGVEARVEYIDDPGGGESTGNSWGVGAYLARDLQVDGEGPGWRLTGAGRMQWTSLSRGWSPVVQFGIGKYW